MLREFSNCVQWFSPAVVDFAAARNFKFLTPVQAAVIPQFGKAGRDVAVEACTGSGKTLSFLIPIVERLVNEKDPPLKSGVLNVGSLCIAPTRELAVQISTVLDELLGYYATDDQKRRKRRAVCRNICVVAGASAKSEAAAFSEIAEAAKLQNSWFVIIGTPGRLEVLNDKLNYQPLQMLVLDEADRLVAQGSSFTVALTNILMKLPRGRVTGVFSATLAAGVQELVKSGLRNPVYIRIGADAANQIINEEDEEQGKKDFVNSQTLPSTLENFYVCTSRGARQAYLFKFLFSQVFSCMPGQGRKAIVFCLTCSHVRYLVALLSDMRKRHVSPRRLTDVCIEKLCGQMTHNARLAALERFKSAGDDGISRGSVLIATDVAARGLDIPGVDWIVQFEAPQDPAMFVHRIGRTARAGETGKTVLLLDATESAYIPFLEGRKIELKPLPANIAKQVSTERLLQIFRHPTVPSNHCLFTEGQKVEDVAAFDEFPWSQGLKIVKNSLCAVTDVPVDDLKRSWEVCRALNVFDHSLLDLECLAFVSIARAYREHQLQFIFIFEELCLSDLANSTGALRLPRVKEVIGKWSGFKQSRIDTDLIPWLGKDSQKILDRRQEKRKEEQQKKEERIKKAIASKQSGKRNRHQRKKRRESVSHGEAEDFATEEREFKRVKKGKINRSDFDAKFVVAF